MTPGRDGPAEKLAFGRDHVDADRRPEINDNGGLAELMECGQAVDDSVGADFFRIVDQQRDTGADPRLDQHMRHRRPVLVEHEAHLVQHRRNGRQRSGAGEPLRVVADEAVDGERQFVRGGL